MNNKFDFIETLPGLVGAKDSNSVYLHFSESFSKLLGRESAEDCRGITDYDIRCKAAEFADEFIKTDKIAMKSTSKMINLDIQNYICGWKLILVERNPIIEENGKIAGLFNQCIDVTQSDLFKPYLLLNQFDNKFSEKTHKPKSYILSNAHTPLSLTERQEHILFFLIRGKTLPDIARKIGISKRTVESHLDAIKYKLNCQYKSEVIEKAIASGFLYYIPEGLRKSEDFSI